MNQYWNSITKVWALGHRAELNFIRKLLKYITSITYSTYTEYIKRKTMQKEIKKYGFNLSLIKHLGFLRML